MSDSARLGSLNLPIYELRRPCSVMGPSALSSALITTCAGNLRGRTKKDEEEEERRRRRKRGEEELWDKNSMVPSQNKN